jgi:uncharacterized Zn ribbon protein
MATQSGTRKTYDSTVGVKLDREDAIHLISPFDVPFLGTYGAEGGSALSSEDTSSKKVEWIEDELVPSSDAVNEAFTNSDTTLTVDNGGYFKANDLIRIGAELLVVSAVSGNDLTVSRGYGDSSAAAHSDGDKITILGTLPVEGADPVSGVNFQRVSKYNMTQIYQDELEVTRSEEKAAKYGVSSEIAYQGGKRLKEAAIKLEQNIILGSRYEDTGAKKRSMGGLDYFITSNVDAATTTLTMTKINDQMQNSFNAGGNVSLLVVGGAQKRVINGFDADDIRFSQDENIRGAVVDFLDTDFGRVYVMLNRWVPTNMLFGLEPQYINLVWFDRWFMEALAKTGDRQQYQLIGECSMKVKNEKAHFKFNALT